MNTPAALKAIDHAQALGADLIVQVGDFGFWPRGNGNSGQKYLRKVDAKLATLGLDLWFIPGNHEDWPSLAKRPIEDDGLRTITEHIREIPVGHRWTWGSTRWLGIGGAPSVDQHLRTEGVDWFPEEEVTEKQVVAIIAAGPADVVVAHDAPMGTDLLGRRYQQHLDPWERDSWWPVSAQLRADTHQERLRRILDGVKAQRWFHGHHHVRYSSTITTARGDIQVEGLALDGEPLKELTLLVDADGVPILDLE
nr:metallophosphoesterase [Propionicimonas sp.]